MKTPATPEEKRTASQLQVLGVLFILFGVLGLFGLLGIGVIYGMVHYATSMPGLEVSAAEMARIDSLIKIVSWGILLLILVHLVFNVLVGIYLMRHTHYWACYVTVIFTILAFPVGTALGVFGLLILSRPEARSLFGVSSPDPQ